MQQLILVSFLPKKKLMDWEFKNLTDSEKEWIILLEFETLACLTQHPISNICLI